MAKVFDYVIITVANQFQKDYLENKLLERNLQSNLEYKILIEKKKVGSGGAVLNLVKQMEIENKKVLLINSAGKCQRMPLYAKKGKICIPTFLGKNKIVFDEIIEETMPIGERMLPGILIVSGDCTTVYKKINKNEFKENTAFSVLTDAEQGKRHGVFVANEEGILKEALQKEPVEVLKNKGAVNEKNQVNIDTGIIYFNENTLNDLKKVNFSNDVIINLYTDLLNPLCLEAEFKKYLYQKSEMEITEKLLKTRTEIWDRLNGKILKVESFEDGKFIHYGTTEEFFKIANERTKNEKMIFE